MRGDTIENDRGLELVAKQGTRHVSVECAKLLSRGIRLV